MFIHPARPEQIQTPQQKSHWINVAWTYPTNTEIILENKPYHFMCLYIGLCNVRTNVTLSKGEEREAINIGKHLNQQKYPGKPSQEQK